MAFIFQGALTGELVDRCGGWGVGDPGEEHAEEGAEDGEEGEDHADEEVAEVHGEGHGCGGEKVVGVGGEIDEGDGEHGDGGFEEGGGECGDADVEEAEGHADHAADGEDAPAPGFSGGGFAGVGIGGGFGEGGDAQGPTGAMGKGSFSTSEVTRKRTYPRPKLLMRSRTRPRTMRAMGPNQAGWKKVRRLMTSCEGATHQGILSAGDAGGDG